MVNKINVILFSIDIKAPQLQIIGGGGEAPGGGRGKGKSWTEAKGSFAHAKLPAESQEEIPIQLPGNTNCRGGVSTVDLLIKVACFVKKYIVFVISKAADPN